MWDSTFMADINNFSEINDNFDTIKTLLNSIRAQGILNTSDVDKLLSGINAKLEKINTEEDIDLIKIFLSELKQNLDERHGILVSKFAAIESLFTNLLKNSSEMPKASEMKELFDIIATNLSVFSREVVSQKEALTDISLRIDAFRSDDSDKKDIIKNIALLKPDLERLNNAFDSIIISLNDNFKTIIKTITTSDKSEYFEKFSDSITNIEMIANTLLSAIQVVDKKAENLYSKIEEIATKEDIKTTNSAISVLSTQNNEIQNAISDLTDNCQRFENLADKIDASVSIVATLKSGIEELDDKNTQAIIEKLDILQNQINEISSDDKFEEFKHNLKDVIENIATGIKDFDTNIKLTVSETENILSLIKSLDINLGMQSLSALISKTEENLHNRINDATDKLTTFTDANITRVINELSSNADILNSRLNKTQTELVVLCEKNFNSVYENITELKKTISQIDENSVSANNAIFSSITDRLTIFENSLKTSLDAQEKCLSFSSAQLIEHIENIKNISGVLDYKLDTTVVESNNLKQDFNSLKTSVDEVLALNFVNTVKDLRVDLYASKQDLLTALEALGSETTESITNDLYGKYELLISKLDTVEDSLKKTQLDALSNFKQILEKISASIVDVISYVSEQKPTNNYDFTSDFQELSDIIKENSLNYIENIRDVVDVIRVQVETYLKNIEEGLYLEINSIKKAISENSDDFKKELKFSYSKLLEIQDAYKEIQETLNINNITTGDKIQEAIAQTDVIKNDLDTKLTTIKSSILDKIADFKQDFTCENADKMSEIKFTVENLYNKNIEDVSSLISELKNSINDSDAKQADSRQNTLSKIIESFENIKNQIDRISDNSASQLNEKIDLITADFSALKVLLKSLNESAAEDLSNKVSALSDDITTVKTILNRVDENIDGDMTRQMSIIESNFESLVSQMTILFDKSDNSIKQKISEEVSLVSDKLNENIAEKLDEYKIKIEDCFDKLRAKATSQSDYLQERIADFNTSLTALWKEQAENNYNQLDSIIGDLKMVIECQAVNVKLDSENFITKLEDFANNSDKNNTELIQDLKEKLDEITKYINSMIDEQSQENYTEFQDISRSVEDVNALATTINSTVNEILITTGLNKDDLAELRNLTEANKETLSELENSLVNNISALKNILTEISADELQAFNSYIETVTEQFENQKQLINLSKDFTTDFVKKELSSISQNIEKETDVIIGEIIEQFDLIRKTQADDIVKLTSNIEELINAHIYNGIEDLKSYLDIKTDNSIVSSKLDNIKLEMNSSVEEIISNLNKMLDTGVFTSSMADYRLANEILINSAIEKLQSDLEKLITEKTDHKPIEEKLSLFDKKFVELIVDKYEEIKLLSNTYNKSFENIREDIAGILTNFDSVKEQFNNKIDSIVVSMKYSAESTNKEVRYLSEQFENLRSQISNKSFDEAFQASINKQISGLEELISKQIGYIEDITDLCATNLPDVAEINTLVKHSVIEKINAFTDKINNQDFESVLEEELKQFKSDIITQFLNIFNQVSFVAEQEEIIDFIQEKHDELITVLSHIVTTTDAVNTVNDNLLVVDNKMDNLKEDIDLINEKITSIISADGDIDYVYSLQDLESDIANLRISLNEIKTNNHDQDFQDLVDSTNQVYQLVESIKTDMAEDIESISTRTNKLILASDESYKALQDNLHDFKLVINDLDERTRNFAQDSGLDRIDAKLNSINSTVVNGAKTNIVFNQVFEYLAEWVDNASIQINGICDKVESLDNIGQIKDMLIELKADSADNSESLELIDALGNIFEKQAKRIVALESKIDKIIADSAIHHDNSKVDLTPIEDTFNKFLVSIDSRMALQQDKINSLETKLNEVMSSFEENESAMLTKKMGGMDRKISKLSKSIEMIASHVIEK